MSTKTTIEWTARRDADGNVLESGMTWNPLRGCRRVSAGCQNCYAEAIAARFSGPGQPYEGLARMTPSGPRWTGEVKLLPEVLQEPLRRKKPTIYFVNSMSDLFFEPVPFDFIDQVFAVMALTPQHTYQILTKRPERMLEYLRRVAKVQCRGYAHGECGYLADVAGKSGLATEDEISKRYDHAVRLFKPHLPPVAQTLGAAMCYNPGWPLPNVWLGTSVENQQAADLRIPLLLQCPAAVHWISAEPILGPLNLTGNDEGLVWPWAEACAEGHGIDWVVTGAESGPGARPMELDWVRSLRDQCTPAAVPFFLKQFATSSGKKVPLPELDGKVWDEMPVTL